MGNKTYKARHKKLGLCVDCSNPALPDRTRCKTHSESASKSGMASHRKHPISFRRAMKNLRERYAREGKCLICSTPLDPDADGGFIYCVNCRQGLNVSKDYPKEAIAII